MKYCEGEVPQKRITNVKKEMNGKKMNKPELIYQNLHGNVLDVLSDQSTVDVPLVLPTDLNIVIKLDLEHIIHRSKIRRERTKYRGIIAREDNVQN